MEIINLGYRIAHNGEKAYNYKFDYEGKTYLLYDLREVYTNDLTWITILEYSKHNNHFDTADLSKEAISLILRFLPTVPKSNKQFHTSEEVDLFFFEPEKEVEYDYIKPLGIWTNNEVNDMLQVFQEFDLIFNAKGTGKLKITEEMVKYAGEYHGYNLLDELLGYKVKCKVKGSHKNDGQLVEYYFTLISPEKVKTYFDTEMCLMVGWNYYEVLKLNTK